MIIDIINLLKTNKFHGAGEYTEIAKGKNEIILDLKTFTNKIKRKWQSRKL